MATNAFNLTAGSLAPDQLFVTSFEAVEALSQPFRLEVGFFPLDGEPLDLQELVGKDASLLVPAPAGDRWFHGEIHAARALGEHGGRLRYQLRIGPKLCRLELIRQSRIFQEKTVAEVVKAVLDEGAVEQRAALTGSYPKLEYCVQYRESDLAFVSRLLERDGIFYFFEHSDSAHTLVLGDGDNAFADMAGGEVLPHRLEGQTPEEEYFSEAVEIHRLRTDAVVLKDFDPLRPALDVSGRDADGKIELYDYPAEVDAPGTAGKRATARLQERGQGKLTLDVRTHCPRLWPGALFSLADHPEDRFNRKLLAVEVRHWGKRRESLGEPEAFASTYRNEVRCLPKETPFRPARRTPRPTVGGLQTAIVAGAAGEEIHPDEHGRVKVQFHWDRQGGKDDKSSCWIRVAQSWGGPGFGALYLPRIGQEVLVRFLEGNPDRPLICGSVYNGEQPPAAKLPGDKTQSTVQSSSSPGGSGSNELRFEDAAREEWISLHAQKDLLVETVNDKGQEVRRDEQLEVKNDRSREVGRHLSHEVTQHDFTEVVKNQDSTIQGKRTAEVAEWESETVDGSQSITIAGQLSVSAQDVIRETVTLAKSLHVGAAMSTMVGVGYSVAVGLVKAETIAGTRSEIVA
ncbi:MAG TPA: type VI secretion system tip protein TssI/VgrG, partial [Myxococcales bacterium]|nr:type VI secretion system tip protein TssI/VgrG [Myxococcales bacterium]